MNTILNPSFNDLLTDYTNGVYDGKLRYFSKKQKKFLQECYTINVIKQNYFSLHDFSGIKPNNFRQYIRSFKNIIDKVIDSKPAFYKLKGLKIDNLTINHTVVDHISDNFKQIIQELKNQPPYLHDIRIETLTSNLYEILLQKKIPNPKNKQILLTHFPIDSSRFSCKVSISQNGRMLVMLGCTHRPLPYSTAGFDELIEYLSQLTYCLKLYSQADFVYEPIHNWRLVFYHFNKDKIVDTPIFKYKIHDLQEHSVTYLKTLENGKKVLRYEKIIPVNHTILEEQEIATDEQWDYDSEWKY